VMLVRQLERITFTWATARTLQSEGNSKPEEGWSALPRTRLLQALADYSL